MTATVSDLLGAERVFWLLQKLNMTTVSALGYSEKKAVKEKERVVGVEEVEVQNPLTVNYPGHHHLAASPFVIRVSTAATYYTLKHIVMVMTSMTTYLFISFRNIERDRKLKGRREWMHRIL